MAHTDSMQKSTKNQRPESGTRRLARVVLVVFLLTFILSRVVVFLIMARVLPDLYLHSHSGTHVHHLNYGIFLLCGVGAWMLFVPPRGKRRTQCAVLYAIGLALTFDEFGMWLHLGGGYWQRASFDAIVVIATLLGLIAYAPAREDWTRRRVVAAVTVGMAVAVFGTMLAHSLGMLELGSWLRGLEQAGPQ